MEHTINPVLLCGGAGAQGGTGRGAGGDGGDSADCTWGQHDVPPDHGRAADFETAVVEPSGAVAERDVGRGGVLDLGLDEVRSRGVSSESAYRGRSGRTDDV